METRPDWRSRIRAAVREPLVHFLIAGLAVFAFSALRGEEVDPASRTITVSQDQVARLIASWQQTWQRPPTTAEIDGLVSDFVKEEIYAREALRLGLDQDDPIIRRRLRAKMEFLARAEAENAEPDDAVLQAWMDKQGARYAQGSRISFDHIYLEDASSAASVKAALAKGADWKVQGQRLSIPHSLDAAGPDEIARLFGGGFAGQIATLTPGGWSGPVTSGYGAHLVRVRQVDPGTMPPLADIRQRVANDWRAATLREREAKAYAVLREGYDIRIARP